MPKVEELVVRSKRKIRADVAHRKLLAMGYQGSERSTRRAVAEVREAWQATSPDRGRGRVPGHRRRGPAVAGGGCGLGRAPGALAGDVSLAIDTIGFPGPESAVTGPGGTAAPGPSSTPSSGCQLGVLDSGRGWVSAMKAHDSGPEAAVRTAATTTAASRLAMAAVMPPMRAPSA